jgi:uncharacterized metal-binding protein
MSKDCCGGGEVMILACSGASNVGQLANQAAVELTQEGFGKMFCLAGVGAHLSGFVQSAKDVPVLVAVDGCDVGCAKGILDHAGIEPAAHIVLTREGLEKNKNLNLIKEDVEAAKRAIKIGLDSKRFEKGAACTAGPATGGCDCGGNCC